MHDENFIHFLNFLLKGFLKEDIEKVDEIFIQTAKVDRDIESFCNKIIDIYPEDMLGMEIIKNDNESTFNVYNLNYLKDNIGFLDENNILFFRSFSKNIDSIIKYFSAFKRKKAVIFHNAKGHYQVVINNLNKGTFKEGIHFNIEVFNMPDYINDKEFNKKTVLLSANHIPLIYKDDDGFLIPLEQDSADNNKLKLSNQEYLYFRDRHFNKLEIIDSHNLTEIISDCFRTVPITTTKSKNKLVNYYLKFTPLDNYYQPKIVVEVDVRNIMCLKSLFKAMDRNNMLFKLPFFDEFYKHLSKILEENYNISGFDRSKSLDEVIQIMTLSNY